MPASNYVAPPIAPPGTFPPGTLITVGAHKCTIERYLSEGTLALPGYWTLYAQHVLIP